MSNSVPTRQIDDFFDNELRNYAIYTIQNRAIPSVIDGFKPSQRKIAFVANRVFKSGNEKPLKVFQLAGRVASEAFYHHGGGSLEAAVTAMAQDFKNSMPIFEGVGQFGSLRSPEAGAPRYVGVKFNENFRLLYKDFDLVDSQFEEGEEIEPKFFLPIIPTVLLNGGSGIAVGFATNILNRNPLDLIDACLNELNGKPIGNLSPWIRGFSGSFSQVENTQKSWIISGRHVIKNTSTVEVQEIPPSFTYEKYEQHLESLVEKGILHSYDDNSSEQVNYVLKFPRQALSDIIKKKKLDDILKMNERETENFTTLDENGCLKIFENAEEIVKYFVTFRSKYYEIRKAKMLKNLREELSILDNRAKFIKMIIEGELIINGRKKEELEKDLSLFRFDKKDGSWNYLTSLPVHTLTKEKFEELISTLSDKKEEVLKIEKTQPIDMYKEDLNELRRKVSKSFKIHNKKND
jgi:DNA topoisomerase-2